MGGAGCHGVWVCVFVRGREGCVLVGCLATVVGAWERWTGACGWLVQYSRVLVFANVSYSESGECQKLPCGKRYRMWINVEWAVSKGPLVHVLSAAFDVRSAFLARPLTASLPLSQFPRLYM